MSYERKKIIFNDKNLKVTKNNTFNNVFSNTFFSYYPFLPIFHKLLDVYKS